MAPASPAEKAGATSIDPAQTAKFTPPDAPYNGAYTRAIPLEVQPFFELTPSLVLGYNSGDNRLRVSDGFGPLGVGWSLSGGSLIERQSAHGGVPLFDSTDAFALDGNGLVDCVVGSTTRATPSCNSGGTHTARYENFERIVRDTVLNTWEVTARDGTVSLYKAMGVFNPGGTQDARLRDSYRWLLASVTDTDGTVVTYSYDCAQLPTCYVTTIGYGVSSVSLIWEARADVLSYATGLSLATANKRLKTVSVYTSGGLSRAYKLTYAQSPDTLRSLLGSVKQYGSDATIVSGTITGGTSLPPHSFTYFTMASQRTGAALDKVTADTAAEAATARYPEEPSTDSVFVSGDEPAGNNWIFGDFNGDGKADAVGIWPVVNSTEATFYSAGRNGVLISDAGQLGAANPKRATYSGDFNGDGNTDLLFVGSVDADNRPASVAANGNAVTRHSSIALMAFSA